MLAKSSPFLSFFFRQNNSGYHTQILRMMDRSSNLSIHTEDKPFKCEFCDKEFTQSNSLNYHMLEHTGDRLFKCKVCKKRFTSSSYLRQHMFFILAKYHFNVQCVTKDLLVLVILKFTC